MVVIPTIHLNEKELSVLEKGHTLRRMTWTGAIKVKMETCEDGHTWGKVRESNGVLVRKCTVCDAIESTIGTAEGIMEALETVVEDED